MSWEHAAFLKLARLGAIVLLPTHDGKYLMQDDPDIPGRNSLRPPGGGKERCDKSMLDTISREIHEEFGLPEAKVREKVKFIGYEYRRPFWGNAVFELRGHGLKPGLYQASNSPDEKVKLVKADLDSKRYVGPKPHKLITEEAKKHGDKLVKKAAYDLKPISFPRAEWDDIKERMAAGKAVSTLRVSDEYDEFHKGDSVITPWGDKAKVDGREEATAETLPAVYSHYSELTPAMQKSLQGHDRIAVLTIRPEVQHAKDFMFTECSPEDIRYDGPDPSKLASQTAKEIGDCLLKDNSIACRPINWHGELDPRDKQSVENLRNEIRLDLGDRGLLEKEASAASPVVTEQGIDPALQQHDALDISPFPTTGPESIAFALDNIDLEDQEKEAHATIKKGLKTKRPDAIKKLGYIQGFKRTGIHPRDLMLTRVPVIPPSFRPFTIAGSTFVPGDANELYRDLVNIKDVHGQLAQNLGPAAAAENRLNVYDAVAALYGYGEPTSPKTKERGVTGFIKKICGTSPKWSYAQSKMIAKDMDYVGRSVIGVDPELSLDEIAIPDEMAWKTFAPYIQRRLVRAGMGPADAVRHIQDRSSMAAKHLDMEMLERPVIYSRAPSWHKFNIIGGWAKRIPGSSIMINPLVTTGLAGDFDGDSGRFYIRIEEGVASNQPEAQADDMLKQDTSVRSNNKLVHIQDVPHLPIATTTKPGVTEYDVPLGVNAYAMDRETRQHKWMPITKFSVHENLQMWAVKLTSERVVWLSDDHSLVIYKNGKLELAKPADALWHSVPRVKKFQVFGDPKKSVTAGGVVGKSKRPVTFKMPLNYDTGLWLGLVIGDGCVVDGNQVYLYGTGDKAVNRQRFEEITRSDMLPYTDAIGYSEFEGPNLGGGTSLRQRSVIGNNGWFSVWLQANIGHGALHKRIPAFSLVAEEEHLWGLLDGLISTDGSISVSNAKSKPQLLVNFCTSSPDLVTGLQIILERLQVRGSVTGYKSSTSGRDAFTISISTVDLAKRHNEKPIQFNHPEKNRIFQEMIGTVSISGSGVRGDQVPYPDHLHESFKYAYIQRNERRKNARGKMEHGNFPSFKNRGRWDRSVAIRELSQLKSDGIWSEALDAYSDLVHDTSLAWEQIIETTPMEERMTGWDITVPGAFTFALDDGTIVQDTLNVHVPSMDAAVNDTKNKLMPSKMLFSIKNRDHVVPLPKQETVLGAFTAQRRPAKNTWNFPDEKSALKAIHSGQVRLSDELIIGGKATSNVDPLREQAMLEKLRDPKERNTMEAINEN